MIGLSVNHQSNGKEAAHSRSWNRFILLGIFQWNEVIINTRLWKRFTEKSREDDNPDIENYIGRAELSAAEEAADAAVELIKQAIEQKHGE